MKTLSIIKYVFSFVGVALLSGAVTSYKNTNDFLKEVVPATGTVVDFVKSRSSDSVSYRPVVRFVSQDGQVVEFTSSVGKSRRAYSLNDTVEVLYSPFNVQEVKINRFFELWGPFMVMLVMGAVFLSIGLIIVLVIGLRNRKKEYLQRHGVAVEAEIQSVDLNESISMNGKSPFMIVCHWLNPETRELHVFESESIWFDPSKYITSETIKVLLEHGNPKKYHVDVSFLPELKN
ncbi:DUF3592 domain-containing protein [Pseudomonas fluorescens]|jgi:uncharacterized membrane protein|uniref:DUF3592 domain-containing protein n=1 Tax=Pseudomonas fluorescens TaxID=294 RepID=UPI002ACA9047|nr:DUF3592 domain-containing protein [Pseudomonas fluorescens]MDZ5435197.1 DUF3592 domain-containing protein [Pseudomonas fluorescens]